MQAMNGLDQLQPVEGMGPVGEVRLVPDLDTFRVLPYAPRTGAVLVDLVGLDGEAGAAVPALVPEADDRAGSTSAGSRSRSRSRTSSRSRPGPTDGLRPVDSSLCFSTIGMTASQDYVDDLVDALDEQAHPARAVLRRARPRAAGDLDRRTRPPCAPPTSRCSCARRSAASPPRHGLVASLAPKPWPDGAGNGCHIHFSLWEGERNRFHDASRADSLSDEARSFIAGVLEHLPGLCGLTAPSFNSYRRIVPHYWAGAFTCWGHDNREAPVRVPSVFRGSEEASTNVELKSADASCNPYLAVGGLIAAGLDGLERGPRAAGAGRGRPGDARARRSGRCSASGRCRRPRRRRSTRSSPTGC